MRGYLTFCYPGKVGAPTSTAAAIAYQFYFSGRTSGIPEYVGNSPWNPTDAVTLTSTATLTLGFLDSPAGDGFAQGYNNPTYANDVTGYCTTTQGQVKINMRYTPAISSGAQFFSLEGSAKDVPAEDTNDQIVIIGSSTANSFKMVWKGNNGATIVNTPDLVMNSAAADTDFTFNAWFNTTASRKLILQIANDPPVVYCGSLAALSCSQIHSIRWGKDATAGQAMGNKTSQTYLFTTAAFQATGNTWCDFNFSTVNTTNLAASSHNSQQVCYVVGSGTRGSTRTDAFFAQWASINNQTTTSTTGFAFDLNLTAADAYGFGVAVLDQAWSASFMFKVPTLANGSTIEAAGAYDSSGNQDLSLYQTASGGVQSLLLKVGAGSSSAITVTTGTWYLVCMDGIKAGTGTLSIYDTSKAQVGSSVTVTCANHNVNRFWLGSPFDTTTSQASGQYFRYSHLILDGTPSNATPVAPLLQWG